MLRRGFGTFGLAACLAISGCSDNEPAAKKGAETPPPYVIGLGEIMGLTQMRHAKLWFAGQAKNWPLAGYELDELKEGLDDAMLYHPRHKNVPEPLTRMIPEFVGQPTADLDTAIRARDTKLFEAAFDNLTMGCNGCHKAAAFGFNVVKRPTAPPFSNQDFEPAAADDH